MVTQWSGIPDDGMTMTTLLSSSSLSVLETLGGGTYLTPRALPRHSSLRHPRRSSSSSSSNSITVNIRNIDLLCFGTLRRGGEIKMDHSMSRRFNSEFESPVAKPVPVATGTGICSDRNFGIRTRTRDQNPRETRGFTHTRAIH